MTTARARASGRAERAAAEDWRAGHWGPSLAERAWNAAETAPTAASIALAVEIRHTVAGLRPAHVRRADALARDARIDAPSLALRLVAADAAGGANGAALDRLDALLDAVAATRFPTRRLRHRIGVALAAARLPRTLALWARERPARLPLPCRPLAAEALALLARETRVDALLVPPPGRDGRVAVVGNAPSLLGAGHGASIDAAAHVVRFNRAVTDEALAADVGRRTDALVLSPGAVRRGRPLPAPRVVLTGCDPLTRPSRYWRHLAAARPSGVAAFPDTLWHTLVARLGAPPSAGLLALAWYERHAPGTPVDAHGFGLLEEEASPAEAANHYADGEPRSTRHDWAAERALLATRSGHPDAARRRQAASPKSS